MTERRKRGLDSGAFTLVELAVVIVIIGVLAAFAIPRFRDAVERSKAGEAFHYLASIRAAQERYAVRQGTYASDVSLLDVTFPPLKYFSVGDVATTQDSWKITLTRQGASAGYGPYTVTFTQDGFDTAPEESSIMSLEKINPVATN